MVVDAVVTWVDGSDVLHIKKRQTYLKSIHKDTLSDDSVDPTRFNSSGEINYCLRSLLHYAPWLRTIYVVTDGQVPSIIMALQGTSYEHRIKIIDHREIFKNFEEYLPTFNSLSIESMLWRIPGLSEQFIYLNDDCALLRPVDPGDFFHEGLPVVRGIWKTQHAHKWRTYFSSKQIAPHRQYQENSAKLAGYTHKFLHLPHVPFPLVKQAFADFFEAHPDIMLKNLQDRVRSPGQFWSISLMYHLGLRDKHLVINNALQVVSVHTTHHAWSKIQSRLARAHRDSRVSFICIQSLDQATSEVRHALVTWLDAHIPNII